MINETLNFLANNLNAYLKTTFQLTEDKAIVSNLINSDGSMPININNKVVICLANIEQENSFTNLGYYNSNNKSLEQKNDSINLNLFVLVAANFIDYNESLKFISATITYFQANPIFLAQVHPEMSTKIEKLALELFKTDANTTSQIWNAMGAKYRPSVIYKARLLSNH